MQEAYGSTNSPDGQVPAGNAGADFVYHTDIHPEVRCGVRQMLAARFLV
jgi:hypothetical protein